VTIDTSTDICADTTARPLRADAARNRQRILQAASEVFAMRGLDVTLDDIARHAGLGTGTVYRRFANREALVEALFEERITRTVALAERCLLDEDPWRGLVTLIRATCAELSRDRGLRQAMLSSSYDHNRVAEAKARIRPLCAQLVERAQEAGVMRPEIQASDVPFIFLMVGTVADFAGDEAPEVWERYFVLLLDGLRAREGQDPLPVGPLDEEQMSTSMSCWRPASRR